MKQRKLFRFAIFLLIGLGVILIASYAYDKYTESKYKNKVAENIEMFDDFSGASLVNKNGSELVCSSGDVGIIGSQKTCYYEASLKYQLNQSQLEDFPSKIEEWLKEKGFKQYICTLSYDSTKKYIVNSVSEVINNCGRTESFHFSINKIFKDDFRLKDDEFTITFRSPTVSACNTLGSGCRE